MKKYLILFLMFVSLTVLAAVPENQLSMRAKEAAFEEKLLEIPVYRQKVKGEILGPVHAEDMMTNKKDAMIRQMRFQAYKMGATAISEFKCKQMLKSLFLSCEGFAVYSAP